MIDGNWTIPLVKRIRVMPRLIPHTNEVLQFSASPADRSTTPLFIPSPLQKIQRTLSKKEKSGHEAASILFQEMELVVNSALHLLPSRSRPSLLSSSFTESPSSKHLLPASSPKLASSRHSFPRVSSSPSQNSRLFVVSASALEVQHAERDRFPADVRVTETKEPRSSVSSRFLPFLLPLFLLKGFTTNWAVLKFNCMSY